MRSEFTLGSRARGTRGGMLIGVAAVALGLLPSAALASELVVPHASAPQTVQPHVVTPAPAASPAPVPPSAAPQASSAPAPQSSHTGGAPVSSGSAPVSSGKGAVADGGGKPADWEDFAGSDVPPDDHDPDFPWNQPNPFEGAGCGLDCLQTWHDWLFDRAQTVQADDPEAAEILRQEREAIDQLIRNESGVPGRGTSDVVDEPGPQAAPQPTPAPQPSVPAGPSLSTVAPPARPVVAVVDAITGVGEIVATSPYGRQYSQSDAEFSEAISYAVDVIGNAVSGMFGFGGRTTTTGCVKTSAEDGQLPICAK